MVLIRYVRNDMLDAEFVGVFSLNPFYKNHPSTPNPMPTAGHPTLTIRAAPVLCGELTLELPPELSLVLPVVAGAVGAGVIKPPSLLPPLVTLAPVALGATVPSTTFKVALTIFQRSHTDVSPGAVK